ncbi:MAG: hypothetical protein HGJ94_10320 [Desulfosarcina sp.]|nr:hypothetical protein [Desulfosarcina sp.]
MKIGGRRCFSFSELTIDVSWDDLLSENEFRFLLSIVPFRENQRPSRPADICLDCKLATGPLTPGNNFQTTESYGLSICNGTGQTVISDGKSAFAIDHHAGKGRITFHSSFPEKSLLAKSNFFLIGLIHLLAKYGYYDLHGAGLTNDGSGCLFLGPSGSGKSSLALNLVKQGWGYASDDALLMNASKSAVSVLSFRKNFYVDPVLAKRFPELERTLKNHGQIESNKYFIDLEEVWPSRFQPRFVPGKVIFCHVSGEETSRIQSISKKDALLRLLPQSASIFFNQAFAQKQVDALKRLIEQTDCYTLDAGFDVYDDSKKAADILSGV